MARSITTANRGTLTHDRAPGRGEIAHDRLTIGRLGRPRQLATGGWVYPCVFAAEGVNAYPEQGHTDYVPASTLSDPAFVEALIGLPVTIDDGALHRRAVTTADVARGVSVGRILSARWDGAQAAIVGEIVVDHPAGLAKIRRMGVRGLSIGYRVWRIPSRGEWRGVVYTRRQTRRADPTHVVITANPRDRRGAIAADSHGGNMDPILAAILASLGVPTLEGDAAVAAMSGAIATALSEIAELRTDAEALRARVGELEGDAADAVALQTQIDALTAERDALRSTVEGDSADPGMTLGQARAVQRVADALGIELSDDTTGADAIKAVRAAMGDKVDADAGDDEGGDDDAETVGDSLSRIAMFDRMLARAPKGVRLTPSAGGGATKAKTTTTMPRRRR